MNEATLTTTGVASASGSSVSGAPRLLLQLEGALVFAAAVAAYAHLGGSWLWFAVLFLAPDLSIFGYLSGPRLGAILYNAAHTYLSPGALALAAWLAGSEGGLLVAAIWIAHIGIDRALGFGLKYGSAFGDTHLGLMGSKGR